MTAGMCYPSCAGSAIGFNVGSAKSCELKREGLLLQGRPSPEQADSGNAVKRVARAARLSFARFNSRMLSDLAPDGWFMDRIFLERVGSRFRIAPKEKKMKRNLLLWLGLSAFAVMPVFALDPVGASGKIHGHVTNPTGAPQNGGTVSLSTVSLTEGEHAPAAITFTVGQDGDYSGQAPQGYYDVSYRDVNTPAGKIVDLIRGVKITAGQDVVADIDMSRAAFIAKLPADQRKALEDLKKQNSSAIEANKTIGSINADLKVATQDIKDAEAARTQAATELGASASIDAINAKVEEIKTAKYTEIVTLMTKDTAAMSDQSILWTDLGRGELGLKNYDDAETHFKKAVTVETASKKPKQDLIAVSDAGLGEVYARQGKITEATAAYDDAVKADPSRAGLNLRNEAIIYFQLGNAAAQIAAADKAIAVDPTAPIPYYIKGQGLIQSATVDAKTQRIVLPPGCEEAYKKYLELAPKGQYAAEVQSILDQAAKPISVNKRGR